MSGAFTVNVNGTTRRVSPGTTLSELLLTLGRRGEGTAIALNEEVVIRSRWPETELHEGDRVEVLTAAQGG